MADWKTLFDDPKFRRRMEWERIKISFSEFLWRFHPRRNRWCDKCGELIGNSAEEAKRHVCR